MQYRSHEPVADAVAVLDGALTVRRDDALEIVGKGVHPGVAEAQVREGHGSRRCDRVWAVARNSVRVRR
jgi:hypothetical protein